MATRHALGDVVVRVEEATRVGDLVEATVAYELGGRVWRQRFGARMLDEAALRRELSSAGLAFDSWVDRGRGWFTARREPSFHG